CGTNAQQPARPGGGGAHTSMCRANTRRSPVARLVLCRATVCLRWLLMPLPRWSPHTRHPTRPRPSTPGTRRVRRPAGLVGLVSPDAHESTPAFRQGFPNSEGLMIRHIVCLSLCGLLGLVAVSAAENPWLDMICKLEADMMRMVAQGRDQGVL